MSVYDRGGGEGIKKEVKLYRPENARQSRRYSLISRAHPRRRVRPCLQGKRHFRGSLTVLWDRRRRRRHDLLRANDAFSAR